MLDIGCGLGSYLSCAAADGVRVVGLEPDLKQIERIGSLPLSGSVIRGDGHLLPFANGTFDAAICIETIEYLADPALAVREAHRVLRTGCRLLVVHRDYDTLLAAIADKALHRRVVAALADAGPDGWAGRRLGQYARSAPWSDVSIHGSTVTHTDVVAAEHEFGWIEGWLGACVRRDTLSADDVSRWQEQQCAAHVAGGFLLSLTRFVCVATK